MTIENLNISFLLKSGSKEETKTGKRHIMGQIVIDGDYSNRAKFSTHQQIERGKWAKNRVRLPRSTWCWIVSRRRSARSTVSTF